MSSGWLVVSCSQQASKVQVEERMGGAAPLPIPDLSRSTRPGGSRCKL